MLKLREDPRTRQKCAYCGTTISLGEPFEKEGSRILHIPCSNDLAIEAREYINLMQGREYAARER